MLDALPANVALLDRRGVIVAVNRSWLRFARANSLALPDGGIGEDYLAVCRRAKGAFSEEARAVAAGIRRVLAGKAAEFSLEYPCHAPTEARWFRCTATPVRLADGPGVVVMHVNITESKRAEEERRRLAHNLGERVKELRALHEATRLLQCDELAVPDLLGQIAALLPPAMQHPGLAAARVSLGREVRATPRFRLTRWRLEEEFVTAGGITGRLQVVYLKKSAARPVEVFFPEERQLLGSLAEMLRVHFERRENEATLHATQLRQRLILEAMGEGIHGLDREGRITFENAAAAAMFGWKPEEMIGRPAHELMHHHRADGAPYAAADCPILRTLRDGRVRRVDDEVFFRKDGGRFPVEYVCSPVRDAAGAIVGAVVSFRDITARRRAAETLRESQALQRIAGHIARLGGWSLDLASGELTWSDEMCAIHEVPAGHRPTLEEAIGYYLPEYRVEVSAQVEACKTRGTPIDFELQMRTTKGRRCWMRAYGEAVRGPDGKIVRLQGGLQDISEKKLAEQALRRSEEEQRRLSAQLTVEKAQLVAAQAVAKVGSWITDLATMAVEWSAETHRIFGTNPASFRPTHAAFLERVHPDDRAAVDAALAASLDRREAQLIEHRVLLPDGRLRHVEERWQVEHDGQGRPVRAIGTCHDITERKLAEETLRRLADRLTTTLESITDAFFTLDREWNFTYLNSEAERQLHRPRGELLGRNVWREFPAAVGSPYESEYRRAMTDNVTVGFEAYYPAPLDLWFEVRAFPSEEGLAVYFHDVTAARRAREELRQSEQRFREMADNIGMVFYNYDPVANRLLYANSAYEKIWERSLASIFADPLSYMDGIHPDDKPGVEAALRRQMAGEETFTDFRVVRANGSIRWVREHAVPVKDTAGRVERLVGTMRDITEGKLTGLQLRESEERFRLLSQVTTDAVWDWDLNTGALWWNEGYETLFGYPRAEVDPTIKSWTDFIHPEDYRRVMDDVQKVIKGGGTGWSDEYRFRKKDGNYIPVSDRGRVIRDNAGRPVRMVGGMTDLTERKLVEEEIRHNTETLAAIVEALQEISTLDQPLPELMRMIAGRAQALTGADGGVVDLIDGDDMVCRAVSGTASDKADLRLPICGSLTGLAAQTGAALLSEDTETDERVNREACRRAGVRSMIVAPLRDATRVIGALKAMSGRPRAFTWRDVGNLQILAESLGAVIQRQAATERLSESEERFRKLLKSVPTVAIQGYATDGTVQYWNDASERFYGYTRDEALGRNLLDLIIPPEMRDGVRAALQGVAEGRDIPHSELELMRKDGSRITVFSSHAVVRREGRPAELFCIDIDLSERKLAEQRVAEQAALLDKANDAILVRDLQHRILYWNRAAERLYGWTAAEAVGRSVQELLYGISSAFLDATKEVLAKGEWTGEIDQFAKDGRTITVEGSWTLVRDEAGRPKSILAINSDVTERKQLQRQFLRAQRMESIGTLAGGIAHDLNNLLAPIVMGAGLLQRQELSETGREVLRNIERSARRSTELVKQVLSFARGVEGERIPLQLGHIVREVSHIIASTFPRNVAFEANLPPDLWLVLGDATQLNQVLLNLCVNARDAMPDGGRLALRAANRRIDAQYAATDRTVPAGDYVLVEVADTGCGMSREVQDRIFEPFFTTKDLGKGTGLGLSTVLGIVRSHGGAVTAQSEPGRGSTFRIWLPAQAEPVSETVAVAPRAALPEGRGELILVVDDELPVLTITRQTLEAFGYRVLTAGDGAQAVGLYALQQKEIAAVLTDLMMPVMDGPMLIASLQRINPQVRLVAATGLNTSEYVNRARNLGVVRFLTKPYTADALLSMMHEVLAGSPEKPADAPSS